MNHPTSPFGVPTAGTGCGSDPLVAAGRELLMDTASVMRTRRVLDKACLDVLAAPGLGGQALEALTAFVTGPQLAAGTAALARIQSGAGAVSGCGQGPAAGGTEPTVRSGEGEQR